ncbi:Uncharacterized protein T19C3.5 [Toxocara canis]|uniref:Uncharacterized protein T19C3.5 n=1 Tax=Toxocara canis TaxID=6265 RepID=A0A0B2UZU3_TOXCA|nr:Uncharacterized protein T19C3.5 [Toxocara canis]
MKVSTGTDQFIDCAVWSECNFNKRQRHFSKELGSGVKRSEIWHQKVGAQLLGAGEKQKWFIPLRQFKANGVRSRLTFYGIKYIIEVIAKALIPELPNFSIASTSHNLTISNSSATIEKFHLLTTNEPSDIYVDHHQPNAIFVSMRNFSALTECTLKGALAGESLNGQVRIQSNQTSLNVAVRIRKATNGSPHIDVQECSIDKTTSHVVTHIDMLSASDTAAIQVQLMRSAPDMVESILCAYVEWIVNLRVNERFMHLPTSISLAQIARTESLHHSSNKSSRRITSSRRRRTQRAPESLIAFIDSFNLSRAGNLFLDYSILTDPLTDSYGIEFNSSGEVSVDGKGGTPFGSAPMELPPLGNLTKMFQIVISDFVPNSLMHHGHKTGLFNTRVDPTTPQLGPVMRTTCGFTSGPLFCLGDLLPTLRHFHPNRGIAMIFRSAQPPVVIFREGRQGAFFAMNGHIAVWAIDDRGVEKKVGEMGIEIEAYMKFRISGAILKAKLSLEKIHLKSINSEALQQDELDDAGLLGREIIQRIVNDVLKDGVPIPIHPLFRLRKTKIALMDRACVIVTDFQLSSKTIRQLVSRRRAT